MGVEGDTHMYRVTWRRKLLQQMASRSEMVRIWQSGYAASTTSKRNPSNCRLFLVLSLAPLSLFLSSLSPHIDCDDSSPRDNSYASHALWRCSCLWSRIWINEHFGWFSITRLHNVDNTWGRFVQRRDTCLFIIKGGLVSGVKKTLAVWHTFLLVREVGSCSL